MLDRHDDDVLVDLFARREMQWVVTYQCVDGADGITMKTCSQGIGAPDEAAGH